MKDGLKLKGHYILECYDKDGNLKWIADGGNTIMDTALDDLLDVYFNSGTQSANWYVALIEDTGYTGIAGTDTAASHPGWTESTAYTEVNRPAWAFDTPISGKTISNPTTKAEFNINASKTIKGAAIYNNDTKGGTSGILLSAVLFTGGDQAVSSGDLIRCQYTINATG